MKISRITLQSSQGPMKNDGMMRANDSLGWSIKPDPAVPGRPSMMPE